MGYHTPALLNESIEGLNIRPEGKYVDLTFGGGGHSLEVLKKLGKKGRLLAFDQDQDAEANLPDDGRFIFAGANFRYLRNFLKYHGLGKVDGILADLGVSSHQIDDPGRGFSFMSETALDMRMDMRSRITASGILNEYPVDKLEYVFRSWGELKNARSLARLVDRTRKEGPILTSTDLEQALRNFIPGDRPNKFLAKVYQALRIEVNGEMDALGEMLMQTAGCMNQGGRLVVISYHSVEDRLVKNYMRSGRLDGVVSKDFYGVPRHPWRLVNRSVIVPSAVEIQENKRARSAKLRIAEMI